MRFKPLLGACGGCSLRRHAQPFEPAPARFVALSSAAAQGGDGAEEIRLHAEAGAEPPYDAILWDLYVGPPRRYSETHPLYGEASLRNAYAVLREGGVFGVWGEEPSPAFERLLGRQGFEVELVKPEGRGSRHAVYLATERPQRRWNQEGSSRKSGRSRWRR